MSFQDRLASAGLVPFRSRSIATFQVNVGKVCNQTCRHCHVDAGPSRRESMTWETMELCLAAIDRLDGPTVDITGGAPELNPHFRRFVGALRARGLRVIVRCNLTILLAAPAYADLPAFYADHRVTVVGSLPSHQASATDRQRGEGIFSRSIEALRRLNAAGFAHPDTGLELHLVHNPVGAFLPASQADLEGDYRRELAAHGVAFNRLFSITNMPIARFKDFLVASGNFDGYMGRLALAFNPAAAANVMCRDMVSVGWDGALYDCDFNQMLDLSLSPPALRHVRDFDPRPLLQREIATGPHCFGCTAGAGSSCGGEVAGQGPQSDEKDGRHSDGIG